MKEMLPTMFNLEGLKSINSLLSQAIELAESDLSAGNWLNFATYAAKQLKNYLPDQSTSFSDQEINDESNILASLSEKTRPIIDFWDVLKILKPAQQFIKQVNELEPAIRSLRKPESEKQASPVINRGGGFIINRTVLNTLVLIILPVLFLNFLMRYR
jgi:hypothetical protein